MPKRPREQLKKPRINLRSRRLSHLRPSLKRFRSKKNLLRTLMMRRKPRKRRLRKLLNLRGNVISISKLSKRHNRKLSKNRSKDCCPKCQRHPLASTEISKR